MKKKYINILTIFTTIFFVATYVYHPVVYAQLPFSEFDIDQLNIEQEYRDPEEPRFIDQCGGVEVGTVTSIYMIGDSITQGAQTELSFTLQETGAEVTIDGVASRRLSNGPADLDGIGVLERSSESYEAAEVIIIALGTNGGLTESGITDAITTIRETNRSAAIYWVNVGVANSLRDNTDLPFEEWNTTLASLTNTLGYTVIDWSEVVQGYESSDNSLGIIQDDGIGVHVTSEGAAILSQLISTALFGGAVAGEACGGALIGSDNQEKIFNFFIQNGFTPEQAAGVVGNIIHESGAEPMRLQGTASGVETPSATLGSNLTNSSIGWGIVQWTPPSKMVQYSFDAGRPYEEIDTLEFQLEFLLGQLNGEGIGGEGSNEKRAGDRLKSTVTVEDATTSFAVDYERCAKCQAGTGEVQKRISSAIDVLTRYGS